MAAAPLLNKLILVTGGSGFVGAHVLASLLAKGANVRATVREKSTRQCLDDLSESFPSRVEIFRIPNDISQQNAFNGAVDGVDGVIHVASPFQLTVDHNEHDLLRPAIEGTKRLLEAIHNSPHSKVEHVVITSSLAAIINIGLGNRPGYTYTEHDKNPVTYEEALSGDVLTAYCASKSLAEKAAYSYVDQHHPKFSVSTICPPMIYGPSKNRPENPSQLNASSADIYRLVDGSLTELPTNTVWAFADVRDVAEAHVRALITSKSGRYIISSGKYSYQQVCDIVRRRYHNNPDLCESLPPPPDGLEIDFDQVYAVSNLKAREELGMDFKGLEECIVDTVDNLITLKQKASRKSRLQSSL